MIGCKNKSESRAKRHILIRAYNEKVDTDNVFFARFGARQFTQAYNVRSPALFIMDLMTGSNCEIGEFPLTLLKVFFFLSTFFPFSLRNEVEQTK